MVEGGRGGGGVGLDGGGGLLQGCEGERCGELGAKSCKEKS